MTQLPRGLHLTPLFPKQGSHMAFWCCFIPSAGRRQDQSFPPFPESARHDPVADPPAVDSLACVSWGLDANRTGVVTPLRFRDVATELAEFFLEEVTLAQGGSYYCRYRRTDWELGVWSQSSNVLELLVTVQLPRPSLVALPGPVVAPGANVSLRCAGRMPGMSFALYRVGVATPLQYIDSLQAWADFPLVGASAPGTYSCYYHTPSAPYVLSQRSQPLVISSEGSGSSDYTQANLIRLGLAGLVLLCMGTLVTVDRRSRSSALGGLPPQKNRV
ncbi:osteoclast-associated immunoglobulin-like receptor isoform X1 [Mesocricetus auratus]|uniref:Osteoclast-associated immunoglobulin-like receptor isoform X1 n=1 Tax=Mesocricetus auratus TaxID=10036 RepID=A0ABM2WGE0_MESAU|nr:osteoclast-associated immunoglobulin-like receptor isoform X1 [Mesocricetus auratus]